MFESIKLRIIKGRQLNPFATAKVLQEHEDRLNALESNSSESTGSDSNSSNSPGSTNTATPTTRDISITVDNGTGAIEGATVNIGNIYGTTGSAGGCTLKGVADGEQTIEVIAEGYGDYEDTITVSADNTSFTVTMTAVIQG